MDNNNPMNSGSFYSGQNYAAPLQPAVPQRPIYGGYQPQVQLISNIERVTSLEEALYKSNARGSDMVYFDQNKPMMYRIRVAVDGTKSYAQIPYTLPEQANDAPATKAEVQALAVAVQELADKVEKLQVKQPVVRNVKKKSEEVIDDESNG